MKILSEDLQFWRAERPDEWIMDRFIEKAIMLEIEIDNLQDEIRRNKANFSCIQEIAKEVLDGLE